MAPENLATPTPILDFQSPLPRPVYEQRSNRLLYFLMTLTLFAFVTGNYGVAFFFVWVITIWWIAVAIHEGGHVLAGWLVGMQFESVSVGSLWLIKEDGKLALRFRRHPLAGQTNMSIDRLRRVRKKLIFLTVGGPAATVLSTMAVILTVAMYGSRMGGFGPGFFDASVYIFVLLSLFTFCSGLFPRRHGSFPNDALILKMLLTSPPDAKRMISAHALDLQRRKGVDLLNVNSRWLALSYPTGTSAEADYQRNWKAYEIAVPESSEMAATLLEKCLSDSAILSSEQREHLICEAAFFSARSRRNVPNAEKWLRMISKRSSLHVLSTLRAETAIQEARRNYFEAMAKCDEALQFLRELPQGSMVTAQEGEWIEWREVIALKLDSPTATLGSILA